MQKLNTQAVGRSIAFALLAVAVLSFVVGLGGAVTETVDSQTVNVTDNESQEIVVDVELLEDPAAQNTTIELLSNESGAYIENRSVSGSAGNWTTERFNATFDGEYLINVTADNSSAVGNVSTSVVSIDSGSGGVVIPTGGANPTILLGVVAIVGIAAYGVREEYYK